MYFTSLKDKPWLRELRSSCGVDGIAGAVLRSVGKDSNPADVKAARAEADELHQKAAARFKAVPLSPMSPSSPGGYNISPQKSNNKLAVLGD